MYKRTVNVNNIFLRERGMASTPKMEYILGFSLHFLKGLSYGYLGFEGNVKILLGRQGKRRGKGRARIEK